jgi:hypothetical protein
VITTGILKNLSTTTKQTLDSILGKWSRGKLKEDGLKRLAEILLEIDSRLDFKQSPRGWCYTLENERVIDKGDFDRAEKAINECRKLGLLPIEFCAEDASRVWEDVDEPTEGSIEDHFKLHLKAALRCYDYYKPYWWEGEKYYIQMLVEKVDLKNLFKPICEKYHIPIANASGWSDINERVEMAYRFKNAEEVKDQKCILLYCGDFDPWGLKIESTLKDNLLELAQATEYDPYFLTIDRFGLNYDFIESNELTWIDNLETSSKKDLSKSYYCYNCKIQHRDNTVRCRNCSRKLYAQPQFVRDYIKQYGVRKCEANALVIAPEQGRALAEQAILKYLGPYAESRFEAKRQNVIDKFDEYRKQHRDLFREMRRCAYGLDPDDYGDKEEAEERGGAI